MDEFWGMQFSLTVPVDLFWVAFDLSMSFSLFLSPVKLYIVPPKQLTYHSLIFFLPFSGLLG